MIDSDGRALASIEVIRSPVETGCELQQLPSRARVLTTAGQCAKPVRDFSKMRTIRGRRAIPSRGLRWGFDRRFQCGGAEHLSGECGDTAECE
jgi:hypothetical protein